MSKAKSTCPYCGQRLDSAAKRTLAKNEQDARKHIHDEVAADIRRKERADQAKRIKEAEHKARVAERARLEKLQKSAEARIEKGIKRRLATKHAAIEKQLKAVSETARRRETQLRSRDKKIERLQAQLDTMVSQDRGALGEVDLLQALRHAFPSDQVERVPRRGDVVQTVTGDEGAHAGIILFESKKTARWENRFVTKAKKDARARGARFVVIVARTLPRREAGVCERDGVFIASPSCAVAVAQLLREMVVALHAAESSGSDAEEKTARLFDYIRSNEFHQQLATISESLAGLREQLQKERSTHERAWSERLASYELISRANVSIATHVRRIVGSQRGRRSNGDARVVRLS